jgi:hypothetical protein
MNERIKKLIEECTDRHFGQGGGGFETFDKEKFADLIVRECIDVVGQASASPNGYQALMKHFGIEP